MRSCQGLFQRLLEVRVGVNVLNVRVEFGLVLSSVQDGNLILALQEAVDEVRAGWAGPSDD